MEYKREESQPQASDIDPRLQESVPPQLYPPPPITYVPNDVRLPPPPQQQQQYSDPSHWPQDGYNQYYGSPPNQQGAPNPQTHNYQAYQANFEAPSQPTEGGVSETKRSRACEACRGLKVRCEPDAGNGPCKRCTKAGRNCVTTAPSRKRQKKTDTRVAELERKIDALTATLHATKDGNNFSGSDEVDYAEEETSHLDSAGHRLSQHIPPYPMTTGTGRKRRMSDYPQDSDSGTSPEAMRYNPLPNPASVGSGLYMDIVAAAAIANNDHPKAGTAVYHDADVVGRGRVSRETANRLFTHYTMYMAPHMPIVAFPSDITAEAVREKSPILFLAILSVASGQDYADLQADLTKDIMRILADRVFVSGEKSLEIIQALQVVAIWYWPEPNGDSKYYQLIHMTAIMAIDLGIDRKQTQKKKDILDIPKPKSYLADPDTIECRRAWVGCYLLCSR